MRNLETKLGYDRAGYADTPPLDQIPCQFQYFDARAGGGKTTAMAKIALQWAALGKKVIICQITCPLIEATYAEHFAPGVVDERYAGVRITRIHSDDESPANALGYKEESVKGRLIKQFNASVADVGEIVMCTHAGLLSVPAMANRRWWWLVIDETPCPSRAYSLNLITRHRDITRHIETVPCEVPGYVELLARPRLGERVENELTISEMARNRDDDDMIKVIQGLARDLDDDNTRCFALEQSYQALLDGDKDKDRARLNIFTELSSSVLDGFGKVVIISALFKDTMLYQSWNVGGLDWQPVNPRQWQVEYPEHLNGNLLKIYYACGNRDFAKYLRDKPVLDENGNETMFIHNVIRRIECLFAGEPFLYNVNKDMCDSDTFRGEVVLSGKFLANATQISGSPHGLNSYKAWHNVAIITALNPSMAHINFHGARGIDSQAVKNAQYRQACYQMMMRCSLRDPFSSDRKRVVVMDRNTAEYLGAMFSGCEVLPLPEVGNMNSDLPPSKAPGRPAKHESDAEKARAYRDRKRWRQTRKRELHEQVDGLAVNRLALDEEVSISPGYYSEWISQEEMFASRNPIEIENKNPIMEFRDAVNSGIRFPVFPHKKTSLPLLYWDYGRLFLQKLADRTNHVVPCKEANRLISSACFVNTGGEKRIGRENVEYCVGIWWDQDGNTDLSAEEFAGWFPELEMVIYATHSSTAANPRWRAYMPTDFAMPARNSGKDDPSKPADLYWVIMRRLVQIVNEHGYYSAAEIAKGSAPRGARCHGFDMGLFRPEAKIYLPCVPFDRSGALSMLLVGGDRQPIVLADWIDNEIDSVLDAEPRSEPSRPARVETGSEALKAARQALRQAPRASQGNRADAAMAGYYNRAPGSGHTKFYGLAAALARTDLCDADIRAKLNEAADNSGDAAGRRRGEIDTLMAGLDRSTRH